MQPFGCLSSDKKSAAEIAPGPWLDCFVAFAPRKKAPEQKNYCTQEPMYWLLAEPGTL